MWKERHRSSRRSQKGKAGEALVGVGGELDLGKLNCSFKRTAAGMGPAALTSGSAHKVEASHEARAGNVHALHTR